MEKRMEDWKDLRFGMFIHWGLYALLGRGEWTMWTEAIDCDEYRKLMDLFSAKHFDAKAWAQIAKDAGMKYMVLTTRHHDGFALWDSPGSIMQFDSVHSASHRDFVREFTDACREAGLKVGLYYSPLDWRIPGFFFPRMYKKSADELRQQTFDQIRELMTNYGKIDIFWFDGGEDYWLCHGRDLHSWEEKGDMKDRVQCPNFWHADELDKMIRTLQPGIVINNRYGMGQYGDYLTPEGRAGEYNVNEAWETCMALNGSWGYVPNPPMSFRKVLETLLRVVTGDGNFLLNVGPQADGIIPPEHAMRLREVGEWLKKYGESIYKTRGGPFMNNDFGGMTYKDHTIYVHVWDWPQDIISLPKLKAKILNVDCLNAKDFSWEMKDENLCFQVSSEDRLMVDTIVRIEIDRPVCELSDDILWCMNSSENLGNQALIVEKE